MEIKMVWKLGRGGTLLYSQNLGGRGRWISVILRSAWLTRASFRTDSKATEKPCLEKPQKMFWRRDFAFGSMGNKRLWTWPRFILTRIYQ